jgi:hypothetical protein
VAHVRREQMLGRLNAALGVGEKRAFQMNAEAAPPFRLALRRQLCQP